MRYFLSDSGARVVVAGPAQETALQQLRPDLPGLKAILPERIALDAQPAAPRTAPRHADDPCLIAYSSGTTGWPKGVVHTNASVATGLRALQRCWRISGDDAVVHVLPLFHIHGLSFAALLTLLAGGRVLLEDGFDPARIPEAIGRGTVFMAVPTIYYKLLEHPSFRAAARGWGGVRLFTCGSAPIRADVLPELEGVLGRPVINRYGMTEAHVIASLPLGGPWPHGSVGPPLEGVELRVVAEDGADRPPGEPGAVKVRGAGLFREYWNQPHATLRALADGWFDTGDVGRLDAAGFLTLVGRSNDLIITGGYNVYPQVVERVLNSCPGVHDSAVVGLPDPVHGERVVAGVVRADPNLDAEAVLAHCAARLVHYQRPRAVHFLDELPRNAMGKVLRGELRERLGKLA
jgi:malonyl-CoA/methylmalonyl-CoA synthetase